MRCNCGFKSDDKKDFIVMEPMNDDWHASLWTRKVYDVVGCPDCGTLMLWKEKKNNGSN